VIGCGLNLLAPPDSVGQAAGALFDQAPPPARDLLVRALGESLLAATDRLLADGFEPFRQEWMARDLLLGRAIMIHDYGGASPAIARGIDSDGALLVATEEDPGKLRRLVAEEVSVRPLAG
jgi:BirA family biotin operon repressor/biotin-[acetyl-CoA-carboxylase] ligase